MINSLKAFIALAALVLTAAAAFGGDFEDARARISGVLKKYGLSLYAGDFKASSYARQWSTWVNLSEEDGAELSKYASVFISEWNKYPVDWVRNSHIKAVAFVKKLAIQKQFRAAMPDAYGEVLYLDIGYGSSGEEYEREVIHHEYYHMIEENYFGDMYYIDETWASFNTPGFEYGSGGASAYDDPEYTGAEHPRKGFVSQYSLYGLNEDKAEVYAYLMTTSEYRKLVRWLKDDPILKKKVDYMKNFMRKHSEEMDEEYFENIHQR